MRGTDRCRDRESEGDGQEQTRRQRVKGTDPNYSEEVQYNLSVSCIIMQCFNNALTSKVWHYRSHSTIARSSVMSMIMSHTRTFHSFKKKRKIKR